jgi:hypothetical protein
MLAYQITRSLVYYGTEISKQCNTTIYKVYFKLIIAYNAETWILQKHKQNVSNGHEVLVEKTRGRIRN